MKEAVGPWRRLREGWMAIALRFGSVQTLLLMALFYAILIGPLGIGAALARRDFLGRRELRGPGSAWSGADSAKPDLERAKRLS